MVVGRKEKEVMNFGRVRVVAFFVDSKTQTDYRRVGGVGEGRVSRDRASRRDGRERERRVVRERGKNQKRGLSFDPGGRRARPFEISAPPRRRTSLAAEMRMTR